MHVLVSAASKHGATAETPRRLQRRSGVRVSAVTVDTPSDVMSLDAYGAVVLGSAVYVGHWLEPARQLVERLATPLTARRVWLFSSGPLGDPLRPDEEPVDVADLVEATKAQDHRVFAGRLDRSVLGFGERALVRAARVSEGNFRDWEAISAWARQIAESLHGDVPS